MFSQGIPKTVEELSAERCKVWSRLFFASLLVSLLFNAIDTGSDVLIMIRYYWEWVSNGSSSAESSCGSNLNSLQQQGNTTELKCPSEEEYYSSNDTIPIDVSFVKSVYQCHSCLTYLCKSTFECIID